MRRLPEAEDAVRARVLEAKTRLVRELGAIAAAVEASATRCPYRDAVDRCTFTGGCRNRIREPEPRREAPGPPHCSGAPLAP